MTEEERRRLERWEMAVRYSVVVILYALAALAVLGVVALADLVL